MKSGRIVTAMLDNGFLKPDLDNPVDFTLFTSRAVEQLEEALKGAKSAEDIAEVVGTMFDAGFCSREDQPDPAEWISYAVQAVKAVRAAAGE